MTVNSTILAAIQSLTDFQKKSADIQAMTAFQTTPADIQATTVFQITLADIRCDDIENDGGLSDNPSRLPWR